MISQYYQKEIQKIIRPIKLNGQYFGWIFDSIILNRLGPYFLREVIFRFLRNDNELRVYLRINDDGYNLDYQVLNDELSVKKIIILLDGLLMKKQVIFEKSLVFTALKNNNEEFFNKLSQFDDQELIELLSLPKNMIENKAISGKDVQILFDFNLNSFGIGDYLMSDRSLIKNCVNNFIITDLQSFFEGNQGFSGIYSDLNLCFSQNDLLNKQVKIIDYNSQLNYLDEKLKQTYFLFLYNQFYELFISFGYQLDFKEYLFKPNQGLDFIIKKLNKDKKVNILQLKEIKDKKNDLFVVNYDMKKNIQTKIDNNKIIIGLSANYEEGFPDNAPKGWALNNWLELIRLLNEEFNNLQFFLLPVNYEEILNLKVPESNYHRKIFNKFKDSVDLVYVDDIIKKNIFNEKIFESIYLKNTALEFLKTAISFCDLVIALDSGPAHMAASLDVPVVSLFSEKGDVHKFKPLGNKSFSLHKEKDGQYLNVNNILAQEVFDLLIKESLVSKK